MTTGQLSLREELRAFGERADALDDPSVRMGGVLTPETPISFLRRGREERQHESGTERPEEAGSTAGSRTGRGAPAPGQTPEAHAIERWLGRAIEVDEVFSHFPGTTWLEASSTTCILRVPVLPFVSGIPATVHFELPERWPSWATQRPSRRAAPDIRTWATWTSGVQVRSHHEYPDGTMCCHMPGEWSLERDPLIHLACFAALWVAKSLHLSVLGHWPGLQHFPAAVRYSRAKQLEYCGCGSASRYGECCWEGDGRRSAYARMVELHMAEAAYCREVAFRGLPADPRSGA